MALLAHIFGVTFPFFALVLCGYVAARVRLLPLDAIPGLNVYLLYLALPAMLFNFAAQTPIMALMDAGAASTYVLCALLMLVTAVMTSRPRSIGWNDASFGALVAVFPNSGFMGVPLLVALLGPPAAAPAIVALFVDMVLTTSLCIGLSRWGREGGQSALATLVRALRGMVRNPLPWAILLGCLSSGVGMTLPGPLDQVVRLLAQSASPVALVTLGALLARPYRKPVAKGLDTDAGSFWSHGVGLMVAYKLLLHPLMVVLVGWAVVALGLPLDATGRAVLILIAALPCASNVPILAERYGADAGRVARIVMLSTVAAFVTFPLLAMVVVTPGQVAQSPLGGASGR